MLYKDKDFGGKEIHELVLYLADMPWVLLEVLRYGQHLSKNSYFICHDPVTIKSIFTRLSHFKDGQENTYPTEILNGKYKIVGVRDLHSGYDSAQPDHKAVLPVSKSSYMVTFTFENGLIATLRTSGTEPKLKYYTELCASPSVSDVDSLLSTLDEMVDALVEEFLQPEKNGLIPRTS